MSMTEDQKLMVAANRELYDRVQFKIEVTNFLASKLGQYLIQRAEAERDDAVRELVNAQPFDVQKITQLQLAIRRAESIQFWMAEIITEGVQAEEALMSMDRAQTDEADDDR